MAAYPSLDEAAQLLREVTRHQSEDGRDEAHDDEDVDGPVEPETTVESSWARLPRVTSYGTWRGPHEACRAAVPLRLLGDEVGLEDLLTTHDLCQGAPDIHASRCLPPADLPRRLHASLDVAWARGIRQRQLARRRQGKPTKLPRVRRRSSHLDMCMRLLNATDVDRLLDGGDAVAAVARALDVLNVPSPVVLRYHQRCGY